MTVKENYIAEISDRLSYRTMLEALAEESAELSQASLKLIRAYGNGNPTPKAIEECYESLKEEISDVLMVLEVMGIKLPNVDDNPKWERWANRVK